MVYNLNIDNYLSIINLKVKDKIQKMRLDK